jgi:hypothetical protein
VRDNKQYILKDKELKDKEVTFDSDGVTNVKTGSDSDIWAMLTKQDYDQNANLCFTLSGVDTKYTNAEECSNWAKGHYYPKETTGTYLEVVSKTTYRGKFADNDGEQLKRINK